MANCQHCNQGAIVKDAYGPICPDCIEEGRYEDGNKLCSDCPPSNYPTDRTRCVECPRRNLA